jgi:hypothetical protein
MVKLSTYKGIEFLSIVLAVDAGSETAIYASCFHFASIDVSSVVHDVNIVVKVTVKSKIIFSYYIVLSFITPLRVLFIFNCLFLLFL